MKPEISMGISDFRKLRKEPGRYPFVDKSLFIRDVISGDEAMLFTRPRRFGKTLNLSMLYYYFSCTEKDTTKLFDGLQIQEAGERYTLEQGRYPTIFLTLKDLEGNNFNEVYDTFKELIAECYEKHNYLLASDSLSEDEKNNFRKLKSATAPRSLVVHSILLLSKWLQKYHDNPVVLLMDEYDAPLHAAYFSGDEAYYQSMRTLMRGFYIDAVKDNNYLYKCVLTSILPPKSCRDDQ